jgi:uncharacterized protein (TIGR03083 family)
MAQLSRERYDSQIEASTEVIAAMVDGSDLTLAIPTCPEWTLRQLATHVGRTHRWAGAITGSRSAEFIPFRQVPDGRFPDDPAAQPAWLTDGARRTIAAIRDAGEEQVWAFGSMAPASFWARRMCHETVVHAADAQLAAGQQPDIAPDVAADAIDEWFTFVTSPDAGAADWRPGALPQGRVLHVHATDDGLDGAGEWLVSHDAGGVQARPGHGKGDVALAGPAGRLLLVLTRRVPADDPSVTVHGDPGVLARWLAETLF